MSSILTGDSPDFDTELAQRAGRHYQALIDAALPEDLVTDLVREFYAAETVRRLDRFSDELARRIAEALSKRVSMRA